MIIPDGLIWFFVDELLLLLRWHPIWNEFADLTMSVPHLKSDISMFQIVVTTDSYFSFLSLLND